MAKRYDQQQPNAIPEEQQHLKSPTFLCDALYCSEENWDEVRDGLFEEEQGEGCYSNYNKQKHFPNLLEPELSWDDEELSSLFAKEEENQLHKNVVTDPSLARARSEAVEWMLKVNAHYSFTALAADLAVNYLDRFLASYHLHADKPWMIQLAAVACLSVAAKVEETQVFLLLDLQVEDSKYVFEAKTIQRMEILVLSTLQWRMHPVTPLSFLDYMTRRLGLKDYLCWEFLRRCEGMVLSVISDCRSMQYKPSVMATATMLHVINGVEPCLGEEYKTQLIGILGIDKDNVEDCSKFIIELASRDYHFHSRKRELGSIPGSPNGVMDVSFSSDSSNDSWAVASSVSSSPEPLSKRSRTQQIANHATSDFLSNPR